MAETKGTGRARPGNGGKRAGAGRKPGSLTKKTVEIARRAAERGITPLEIMLEAMEDAYKAGGAAAAVPFAKDAAPYMHPRIATVEHKSPDSNTVKVDVAFGLPESVARVFDQLVGPASAGGAPTPLPD